MTVACFCGHTYDADDDPTCPNCGAVATMPWIPQEDVDAMIVELQTLLDEHGILPE